MRERRIEGTFLPAAGGGGQDSRTVRSAEVDTILIGDYRLIDVFRVDGRLVVWLFDETAKKSLFAESVFSPPICVHADSRDLLYLKRVLDGYGIASSLARGKTLDGVKTVLEVRVPLGQRQKVIADLARFGRFSYELYNVDIPVEDHFLFVKDLFATARVRVDFAASADPSRSRELADDPVSSRLREFADDPPSSRPKEIRSIVPLDHPSDEYSVPALKSADIGVETSYPLQKDAQAALLSVRFNKRDYSCEELAVFIDDFRSEDPDILITVDGNRELPFLLDAVRRIDPSFSFSRFGRDSFSSAGRSYVSYGRTIYKQDAVYLKGRLHLQSRGVMYGEWDLCHPFELARMGRCSVQRANHRSAGYCVSNLQLYTAMKRGFLVARTKSCVEVWKSGLELFDADRGSLIFEPRVGFHADTAELDFVSLFPSVMVRFNISTETLFCRCCPQNRVPGLSMNICAKARGIIPESLEPLIRRRVQCKSIGDPVHAARADAIKGMLVTSFGYMGFRKSRFARIEAHQAIQAYAREILLASALIAEEHGFEVLHGIVDSLWVRKDGLSCRPRSDRGAKAREDLRLLIADIKSRVGFDMKLEGIYRWIVFLPSTRSLDVPVPTRYYGVFEDGSVKLRGIEARKHDTPAVISGLQKDVIAELAGARDLGDFKRRMRSSLARLDATIKRLVEGNVPVDELVITRGISRSEYRSRLAQAIIVDKLKRGGFAPKPGHYIRYVIADKGSDIVENRYAPVGDGNPSCKAYDREEYVRLARRSIVGLFSPFIEKGSLIADRQLRLWESLRGKEIGLDARIDRGVV